MNKRLTCLIKTVFSTGKITKYDWKTGQTQNIGDLKRFACLACRGDVLVEVRLGEGAIVGPAILLWLVCSAASGAMSSCQFGRAAGGASPVVGVGSVVAVSVAPAVLARAFHLLAVHAHEGTELRGLQRPHPGGRSCEGEGQCLRTRSTNWRRRTPPRRW